VPGRASGVKMVVMAEVGHQLVWIWMRWQSIWIVGASVCVIFIFTRKSRRWRTKIRYLYLKEEKTCEDYQIMVKDTVAGVEWKYLDVNEHWQQMKNIMMDTAQVTRSDTHPSISDSS